MIIEMKRQAIEINKWSKNIFVKVPITNSKGKFMGKIINELSNKKIKLIIYYTSIQLSSN